MRGGQCFLCRQERVETRGTWEQGSLRHALQEARAYGATSDKMQEAELGLVLPVP